MCGDDRGWRPAPHIGDEVGHKPVLFGAAGEGRIRHPGGHGRAIAWALRANSGGCGLPICVRASLHFDTGRGRRRTRLTHTAIRRLANVAQASPVEEWARGRRPRTLLGLRENADPRMVAESWRELTSSAAFTRLTDGAAPRSTDATAGMRRLDLARLGGQLEHRFGLISRVFWRA